MTNFDISWWIWFNALILTLLIIDLKFIPKTRPRISVAVTLGWVTIAGLFACLLYAVKGSQIALEFTTGYLIEESLSIDNLFVFLMVFQYFRVPDKWQQKILMYGILGAMIMRFIFIIAGISLIQMAPWLLLVFGVFLVFTGIMMFKKQNKNAKPKEAFLVQLIKKWIPCTDSWETNTFFTRINGKLFATPAFLVLCTIEATDLVFAMDSIPAIFAITLDPFVVYSCNALAVVGLRSLFFVLKDLLNVFEHLHYGISLILIFVGMKMLIAPIYHIATLVSLSVIGVILLCCIGASYVFPTKK
jgi:tellurite resistance protein TerC